jgi:hypothetical protein
VVWHGPAGRCISVLMYVNILDGLKGPCIYMSRHVYGDPNVCYMCCFILMMLTLSICCDRMYEMVMYV